MAELGAGTGAESSIFISYSLQDAALAKELVATLENAGLRCWIAPRDVTPGAQYAEQISRAVSESDVLLLS